MGHIRDMYGTSTEYQRSCTEVNPNQTRPWSYSEPIKGKKNEMKGGVLLL